MLAPSLGEPGTPGGLILPGNDYSPDFPPESPTTGEIWTGEGEGFGNFFFPGGYGFLPELVNTGAGWSGKPPVSFNFTLQGGYNDNIYSTDGKHGQPKKGSFITQATLGGSFFLANQRHFLTLTASAGASYYWSKDDSPLAPVVNLGLTYGYKISPRTQFSARINGGYYNQPDLANANANYRPNAGDYVNVNTHFDLSHQWTPRFSTVTSVDVNTRAYTDSLSHPSNYISLILGEAFRLKLAPRHTGVFDIRVGKNWYKGSDQNSQSLYLLLGLDSRLTPRLNSTLRIGSETRQYDVSSKPTKTRPYLEGSLGYQYGRGSTIRWANRIGFEDSGNPFQSDYTARTGLYVDHVLTSRIALNVGGTYSYSAIKGVGGNQFKGDRQTITGTVGGRYLINRHFTVFANYTYTRVLNEVSWGDYAVNAVWLGTSYYF